LQIVNGSEVGSQMQRSQSALLNWPVVDEIQPSADVQVIVYSPVHSSPGGVSTQCISDITGVASQPQVTAPKLMIWSIVGSTLPGQFSVGIGKTVKSITHGCPMFTMPVAVAEQPLAVVHVMVYSQ
jgi:hypothetical protein